jgi:hypothetical protein
MPSTVRRSKASGPAAVHGLTDAALGGTRANVALGEPQTVGRGKATPPVRTIRLNGILGSLLMGNMQKIVYFFLIAGFVPSLNAPNCLFTG